MPFDSFLKIEGIDGESIDRSHPNEIEVESFSWGEANTGGSSGGGGGAGKAVLEDFHFTMPTSKASPNLMLACATGRHFQSATLTCRKSGGSHLEFLKIKLTDILVSSYELGAHATDEGFSVLGGDDEKPTDRMSLNFVKIDFLYTVDRTGETVETTFSQI
jgi:type VI secretion system secreted protein Hcp